MCEAEPLCAENIGLKDIARSRSGELISRGELIMYYSPYWVKNGKKGYFYAGHLTPNSVFPKRKVLESHSLLAH